jgi:hypothetical protein
MKHPHPLTIEYVGRVRSRPEMFHLEGDLSALQNQLYGFDAALLAAGLLSGYESINHLLTSYVSEQEQLSGCQGWALAITDKYGNSSKAQSEFWRLYDACINSR